MYQRFIFLSLFASLDFEAEKWVTFCIEWRFNLELKIDFSRLTTFSTQFIVEKEWEKFLILFFEIDQKLTLGLVHTYDFGVRDLQIIPCISGILTVLTLLWILYQKYDYLKYMLTCSILWCNLFHDSTVCIMDFD